MNASKHLHEKFLPKFILTSQPTRFYRTDVTRPNSDYIRKGVHTPYSQYVRHYPLSSVPPLRAILPPAPPLCTVCRHSILHIGRTFCEPTAVSVSGHASSHSAHCLNRTERGTGEKRRILLRVCPPPRRHRMATAAPFGDGLCVCVVTTSYSYFVS